MIWSREYEQSEAFRTLFSKLGAQLTGVKRAWAMMLSYKAFSANSVQDNNDLTQVGRDLEDKKINNYKNKYGRTRVHIYGIRKELEKTLEF